MAAKVGKLIKEARTHADLTQEELARKVGGLSASDISKAERGEKELTQVQLKKIAKVCGVTQASLLNAAKGNSKQAAAKKPAAASLQLTAAEKKFLQLYRSADSDARKAATRVLKGECSDLLTSLLGGHAADALGEALGNLFDRDRKA